MTKLPHADIIFFVQIGSSVWAVTRQGEWLKLDNPEAIPAAALDELGLVYLNADALEYSINGRPFVTLNDTAMALPDDAVAALKALPPMAPSPDGSDNSLAAVPGQPAQDQSADPDQQGINFGFSPYRQQHEKIVPRSGFDTEADAPNAATATEERQTDANPLLPLVLGIQIEDGGDNYLNQAEIDTVSISGDATNGRDGDTLLLEIIDSAGNRLTFTVIILNERWSIEGLDLSSLAEGPLTATISAPDYPGQVENASDDTIKDTLASIDIAVDSHGDGVLSGAESPLTDISGKVSNVQNGQKVVVTVTDSAGNSLQFETVVNGNQWQINDADLSSLADGELTFSASTTDIAGNPAITDTVVIKDTSAVITIEVGTGKDDTLNWLESHITDIFGTVTGIEDGQTVKVQVTDINGKVIELEALVTDGVWRIDNADLTGLADGPLQFSASSVDLAGNPANSAAVVQKDTFAKLSIDVAAGADDVLSGAESAATRLFGSAQGIEDGSLIRVTVINAKGEVLSFTTVLINGAWSIDNADLSSINDGHLLFIATALDEAGNPALGYTVNQKDSTAQITVVVDGGDDGVINDAESHGTDISGTVSGVEDGQTVTVTVTDKNGNQLTFTAVVSGGEYLINDADLSSLADGELVFSAGVSDVAGNSAIAVTTSPKDTTALLAIDVAAGADEVINGEESKLTDIFGKVTGVEDGQTVTVTVTDKDGKQLTFTAIVSGGEYLVDNADLSSLADGELKFDATVTDVAGNTASASTENLKDTLASISIDVLTGEDEYIDRAEQTAVDITGTVSNIEDGQTVTVTITDKLGNSLTFTTTVVGGEWQLDDVDLSSLANGELTFDASAQDLAGNPADASAVHEKDTSARIFVWIADNDHVINAAEQTNVTVRGVVLNVENGQTITVTLSDGMGKTLTLTTVVNGNLWAIPNLDLTGFADGMLYVTADVSDVSGNPAHAENSIPVDLYATITIDVAAGEDDVINGDESKVTDIFGTVTDIEDGQTVTVTVTDKDGKQLTFTAIVSGGEYLVDNADLSSLADGELKFDAAVTDVAGNTASASTENLKDTLASITIDVLTGEDEYIDRAEQTAVDITGTVSNIEDGQTVTVTITDKLGKSLTFTTTVVGGEWQLDDVDLSSLANGDLTFDASAQDLAGNPADASTVHEKDTSARIFVWVADNDHVINAAEQTNVTVRGVVLNVENGQTITVTLSDGMGKTLTLTTVVSGNLWSIPNLDLTGFADGMLYVTADVSDVSGNPAHAENSIPVDLYATITIDVAAGSDDVINGDESKVTDIFGTVTDIEDGQTVTITVTDKDGKQLTFTAIVSGGQYLVDNADLSSLADGELKFDAAVTDVAANTASASTENLKDTGAAITIDVAAGADDVINAEESKLTDIFGTVAGVEDGQTVTVTVTDKDGKQLTFTAIVSGGEYLVDNADLSSLADGELKFDATVTDVAGNTASASTENLKDTLASISIDVLTGDDEYIDRAEQTAVDITGTVSNIEDGQTVTVTITDKLGKSLTFTTTVVGGEWQLDDVDLSSLANGELSFDASAEDLAGNPADASAVHEKDTSARIFVWVADNNHVINAAEQSSVTVRGVVLNVENGQTITVTLSDGMGKTLTLTTVVNGNLWAIPNLDLTGFADGMLYVTADVSDVAGNPAHSENSIPVDLYATITIDVAAGEDDVINGEESKITDIFGTVTDIEDGQTVTVTVTDKDGKQLSFTAVVSGGQYLVDNADLSSLADGELKFDATASDIAGNSASAATSNQKDTGAAITIDVIAGADDVINAEESKVTDIFGTTAGVEDGQTVTVTVTDKDGKQLTFTTTATGNAWFIDNADLSSLADGELKFDATVTDISGNTANASTSNLKDSLASITVVIVDGGDELIGSSEAGSISLSGTTSNIEPGRTVTLVLTDSAGHSFTTTATVSADGSYSVSGIDLVALGFVDGQVKVDATVSDAAGNNASASDTSVLDTQISIDIDTGDGYGGSQLIFGMEDSLKGTTTGVEAGQTVTLSISDGKETRTFTTLIQADGSWQFDGLDVAGMDKRAAWMVDVTVSDKSGNSASDALPTLYQPADITVYEAGLILNDSISSDVTFSIPDATLSISAAQPLLSSITSMGQTLVLSVASDGMSLTASRSGDGAAVFTASLSGNVLTVTLLQPLDQISRAATLFIQLEALQNDADGTSETVFTYAMLNVVDAPELTLPDVYETEELVDVSGSVFANDFSLEGLTLIAIEVEGTRYNVQPGTPLVVSTSYGELTIDSKGVWHLKTAGDLDNRVDQLLDFRYYAVDADGSKSSSSAYIRINDGNNAVIGEYRDTLVEPKADSNLLESRDFIIVAGSDALVADSMVFNAQTPFELNALGITSNGNALSYSLSADGKQITASAGGEVVFVLTLAATSAGRDLSAKVTLDLRSPLDHLTSELISLKLKVNATDSDGTAATQGKIIIDIQDGNNPAISNISRLSFDENNLLGSPIVKQGTMDITVGSDELSSLTFGDLRAMPVLTAGLEPIVYQLSADGTVLTAHTGDPANPVFVVQLNSSFNTAADTTGHPYQITLLRAFDQPGGLLSIPINLTDKDGDTTKAQINFSVADGAPAVAANIALEVSELPSDSGFNRDSGSIDITATRDPVVDVSFAVSAGAATDKDGNPLTQNGQAINWVLKDGGAVLEGRTSSGALVLTVSLPKDINISAGENARVNVDVKLLGPIDQLSGDGSTNQLQLPIRFVDSDGSEALSQISLAIHDGLAPSIDTPMVMDLNEQDIPKDAPITITGNIEISQGSDSITALQLAEGFSFDGYSSGGLAISLSTSADADGWYIATRSDGDEVFRLKLDASGAVTFQQTLPMDHPIAGSADVMNLNFQVQAVDADNDRSAAQTITVALTDAIPLPKDKVWNFFETDDSSQLRLFNINQTGRDTGTLQKIIYKGVEYHAGDTIELFTDTGERYGTLTVNKTGLATLVPELFTYASVLYTEDLVFTIEDKDGDTDTAVLTLNAKDSDGKVVILDPVFHEDTEGRLDIFAYPGDKDENETISAIKIDAASLAGGSLFIDGIQIFPTGGTYLFAGGALLVDPLTGTANIRGNLTYLPADDLSDATDSINIKITVTIDRNGSLSDTVTEVPISVVSVADAPEWDSSAEFSYSVLEDAAPISLNLSASSKDENGADAQGSETVTFRISNISDGLTLTTGSKTVTEGMLLTPAELAALKATIGKDMAGVLTFDVTPISTEDDNGDVATGVVKTVEIDIKPVADKPSIEARDISSDEDKPIDARDIVGGSLSDSSETLGFEFTLPDGWIIDAPSAVQVSPGIWTVSGDDVNSGNAFVVPKADVSSATFGNFELSVRSFSSEETQDGIPPADGIIHPNPNYSESQSITIKLRGVANDAPTIDADPARWVMDDASATISNQATLAEDTPIKLDFLLKTSDDDGSETLDLTLTGIPEGAKLIDAAGNPVNLPVVGFNGSAPVYSVSAAELASLSLVPPRDFSGDINLTLNVQSTEKDGDSTKYSLTVALKVSPVVDETGESLITPNEGLENRPAVIDLAPFLGADIDASESITGLILLPADNGLTLLIDGRPISIPAGGLDLSTLTDASSPTLDALIHSGRLALLPPQDADGEFDLAVRYQITDTSNNGETVSSWIDSRVHLLVDAQVNITTEIKATEPSLVSSDGSPIDITGQVKFFEADIDGSERLDYVEIVLPSGTGWYVEHPLGAIHDGNGRWLIKVPGVTTDTVREWGLDILKDVKIISDEPVTDAKVTINARVLDRDDGEIISTDFTVTFLQGAGNSLATEVDDLQLTVADAVEDEGISFAGHLNSLITTDTNDVVSFRVLASDLPQGGYFTGADVEAVYNASGKAVIEWVFTTASLGNLALHGISEHYAGDLSIPIRIIATDSLSGDTKLDETQTLEAQIAPKADGAILNIGNGAMDEDTPVPLGIKISFVDPHGSPTTGGNESFVFGDATKPIELKLLDGGSLQDDSGLFQLKAGTTDTWVFTGTSLTELGSALNNLRFVPPLHLAGEFGIAFSATAIDTAMVGGALMTDTRLVLSTFNIIVNPVTDASELPGTTVEILGDEDSLISLAGLDSSGVGLIDQDGSEVIYLTVSGVPAGSVLYYQDAGGNLIQLPNTGPDGGSFNGKPTFAWSVEPEQLSGLVLLPPENFSGDIKLNVGTVTWEQGTNDYVNNGTTVIVGVRPIADGLQLIQPPQKQYAAEEDEVIDVKFKAETLDVTGQEQVRVTVIITSADSLEGLEGVTIGGSFVSFTESGGVYTATVEVAATSVNGLQIHPGPLAFGTLKTEVRLESIDSNTVLGTPMTDVSSAEVLNFDIVLTPEVDPPVWTAVNDVVANDPNNLLLGLGLALQNPAPGETGKLEITGLPAGMTLEGATQSGSKWVVDIANVGNLKVLGASDGDSFVLTLKPSATLSGETVAGTTESISVTVDVSAPALAAPWSGSNSISVQMDDGFYWGGDAELPRFVPGLWDAPILPSAPTPQLNDASYGSIKEAQPTLYRYQGPQLTGDVQQGDAPNTQSPADVDRMPQIDEPGDAKTGIDLDLGSFGSTNATDSLSSSEQGAPQFSSGTMAELWTSLSGFSPLKTGADDPHTEPLPEPMPMPEPEYLATLSELIGQSIESSQTSDSGFFSGIDTGNDVIIESFDGTEQLNRLMEQQQLAGQQS
ncbi:hypothetical protein KJI95_18190 [Shewanella sp. JM162201]|uniref:Ig-like domain (Group 3) n=1 Tax=Shewanella jiangmenensis TaxID=2837387 RepID=A0ABS5VBK4_9GAMM|nr:hypothetical protein [Shewanella jiangmenensis]MBT1446428.1 hypothetical protein [Shewanella jiangmenensis]